MSLASLTKIAMATIKRNVSTAGSAGGQIRNYTTAGRGSLPTTSTGRLVQDIGDRRFAYEMHDFETPAKWYTTTNPQCSAADVLVINGITWFCQDQMNPDTLNRYFIVTLKSYDRGVQ